MVIVSEGKDWEPGQCKRLHPTTTIFHVQEGYIGNLCISKCLAAVVGMKRGGGASLEMLQRKDLK